MTWAEGFDPSVVLPVLTVASLVENGSSRKKAQAVSDEPCNIRMHLTTECTTSNDKPISYIKTYIPKMGLLLE